MKLITKNPVVNSKVNSAAQMATVVTVIALATVSLAGCTTQSKSPTPATGSTTQPNTGTVKADQKVGDTTLSGTVTKVGEEYLLSIPGKPSKGLDSYKIKLSEYVGQSVKVTGQYSGDTLFVSKIE